MAIRSSYKLGGEIVSCIINGNSLMFMDSNGMLTTIEGLKISRGGVLKEFPELENNDDWRKIAIERLKEKINSLITEFDKTMYVKEELEKFGYQGLFMQEAGFRPKRFK